MPVNGPLPLAIDSVALSSKTVLVRLEPVPPGNRTTVVPSGAISEAVRSEAGPWAILTPTLRSLTWRESVMVMGTSSVPPAATVSGDAEV